MMKKYSKRMVPTHSKKTINEKRIILNHIFIFALTFLYANPTLSQLVDLQESRTESYGNQVGVNHSTGTLNYSIPLFEISSKGVSIPIGLNYDGSGVKVFSDASWVGQGWDLSHPGIISRERNGVPDDVNAILSNGEDGAIGYLNFNNSSVVEQPSDELHHWTNLSTGWLAEGKHDLKPDVFNFSALSSYNGSFSLKRITSQKLPVNGSAISNYEYVDYNQNVRDLEFNTDSYRRIIGFHIKDVNGLQFNFNQSEMVQVPQYLDVYNMTYANNWYLTEIRKQGGVQLFNLEYSTTTYPLSTPRYSAWRSRSTHQAGNGGGGTLDAITLRKKYLDRITYDDGYVDFVISEDERDDLSGHYALSYIRHYDNNENLLDEYEFIYEYRGDVSSIPTLHSKRMFLKSILYKNTTSPESKQIFECEYNELQLPYKESSSIDNWGYFNGEENSHFFGTNVWGSLGPAAEVLPNDDIPVTSIRSMVPYSNREPHKESAMAGILTSVNYLSGSSMHFNYELHDYSFIADGDTEFPVEGQLVGNDISVSPSLTDAGDKWRDEVWLHEIVEFPQWVEIKYSKNDGCNNSLQLSDYYGTGSHLTVPDGEWLWIYIAPYTSQKFEGDLCFTGAVAPTIEVRGIRYHDSAQADSYRRKSGGLRIEEIISSDNNGSSFHTKYKYDLFTNSKKSSGVLIEMPNRPYKTGKIPSGSNPNWMYINSVSRAIADYNAQNNVYYKHIETYTFQTDNEGFVDDSDSRTEIGRKLLTFIINPSTNPLEIRYPFAPIKMNVSRRVQLDTEVGLNPNGTQSYHKKFNYITQIIFPGQTIYGRISVPFQYIDQGINTASLQWYKNYTYAVSPEITQTSGSVETLYDNGASKTKTKEITYVNLPKLQSLVSEQITTAHTGDQTKIVKSYSGSFDFGTASASGTHSIALKALIDGGRLTEPVEEIHYIKKAGTSLFLPISRKIFLYKKISTEVVLEKIIDRIIVNPHDEVHNLLTLTGTTTKSLNYSPSETDMITSFSNHSFADYLPRTYTDEYHNESSVIFDDKRFAIAKVANASLNKIRYTSFERDGNANNGGWIVPSGTNEDTGGPEFAVSGNHYYHLEEGQISSGYPYASATLPVGKYLLTYYRKNTVNVQAAGGVVLNTSEKISGEWIYVEKTLEWNTQTGTNYIFLSGSGYIDELRLCPIDAVVSTFGYFPDGKIIYEGDPSGAITTYEYDTKGRLEWILNTQRFVLKHFQYKEKHIGDIESFNSLVTFTSTNETTTESEILNWTSTTGMNANHNIKMAESYSDGLGRHRQTIEVNADHQSREKISFSDYNPLGRQTLDYLPYYKALTPTSPSSYRADFMNEHEQYHNSRPGLEATNQAYCEIEFDNTPLQRIVKQGGIGEGFQLDDGHAVEFEYGWNTTEAIRQWNFDHGTGIVSSNAIYPAGKLSFMKTTDQNGNIRTSWKDHNGRNIAKTEYIKVEGSENEQYTSHTASINGTLTAFTSYLVYDDFGRVVMEISAYADKKLSYPETLEPIILDHADPSNLYRELITSYKYDHKGRVIEKRLPGQYDPTYFVYNKYDELVLSQNYLQAVEGMPRWSFVKRDSRHRVIMTGEWETWDDRSTLQEALDGEDISFEQKLSSGGIFRYTNIAIPNVSENDVFNVYYFDNYDFDHPPNLNFVPFDNYNKSEMLRGLPTGSKTRVFTEFDSNLLLNTVSYYDDKGRVIQAHTENMHSGRDQINTWYTENSQVLRTQQIHRYESASDPVNYNTEYEYVLSTGQLKNTYVTINDDSRVKVSERGYNSNGSLAFLGLHKRDGMPESNYMQVVNYGYNAQGRLTHINNPSLTVGANNLENYDVFGQEITYHELSDEYDPDSSFDVYPQYNGNISSMIWKAKAPDEDGAIINKHAYIYRYDESNRMTAGYYATEELALEGTFSEALNGYTELVNYNMGGNIKNLVRNRYDQRSGAVAMDDLSYTYYNSSYKLSRVSDVGIQNHQTGLKHFVNGSNQHTQYVYDSGGRVIQDKNRSVNFEYNRISRPKKITRQGMEVGYAYDAAGNKLRKAIYNSPMIDRTTYVGNFIYENNELKMIYHPEGVIRPKPAGANNSSEYVFDYFVKDYLGNVRAVVTEEDAVYTDHWLASLEQVHAHMEEMNFDNLEEVRADLPTGYPVNGSIDFNEKIALLNAANGTEIGPSIVFPVQRGEKIKLSTEYFYTEDAPGTSYTNLDFFINEILIALAAGGSGVLPLNETRLVEIANGQWNYGSALESLFATQIDTSDVSRPYAYMVWTAYDSEMELLPENSGVARVENPNDLQYLLRDEIEITKDGYLHAYVTNGSTTGVSFDNFHISRMRGKLRQINHYYPYGLSFSGLNIPNSDEYLNKYTSKELQTGEWNPSLTTGLEMYDFHARFYDPQLGRWFAPDPAEQFHNPYLAMGNNPAMFVDHDGKMAELPVLIVIGLTAASKAAIVGASALAMAGTAATLAATSTSAISTMGPAAQVPPDGYVRDVKTNELHRINDIGREDGIDIIMDGIKQADGSYTFTGQHTIRPMHQHLAMKYPSAEFGFTGLTLTGGPILSSSSSTLSPMPALPANITNQPLTGGKIQTGLTVFDASSAAKMNLIKFTGGGNSLPGWYSKGMARLGQLGAFANVGVSGYQYATNEISGVKFTYDASWAGLGLSPHPLAQWYYWNGVAGQNFGPSTWGWDIFGPDSYYGQFKYYVNKP